VIRKLITQVRDQGYMLGENTVATGVTGLGVAVPSAAGVPYLGLSISAISSRVTPTRVPKLRAMLKASAQQVSDLLSDGNSP
jgi:DNA-binding IclR family transcriptional regulator